MATLKTLKTGWVKKIIDGVSTKIFAISHVKSTYYDYTNGKTLKSKLDDMDKSISEKSEKDHTHSYAGSDSVGGAATSAKECTGNSATATKATQDSDGNIIKSTYSKVGHTHSNYASKSIYDDTTVSMGRKDGQKVGDNSFAFGYRVTASNNNSQAVGFNTTASGDSSHAEGGSTIASGAGSHAEGWSSKATNNNAHAEGGSTTASGDSSHAEGLCAIASGASSHAEGNYTKADGDYSHAEGNYTTALTNQHAQGHFNNTTNATDNSTSGTSTGTAFVIGNGTSSSKSNAFRVTGEGATIAKKAYSTSGADYAEYFEWEDGNPNSEDRRGLFVTTIGDKIRIANSNDWILGVVSALPSVIGNHDEEWMGRYILDDFGDFITETFEYETKEIDKETGEETTVTKTGTKWKENPDYDPSKEYLPRAQRKEWDAIGLLGVLNVVDDGTCEVNGFCKVVDGGTVTQSATGYRVIKRVTDNIVKILIK